MKHIIPLILVLIAFNANSQADTLNKGTSVPSKTLPATITQKPIALQQPAGKNTTIPKLAELRIVSFDVKYLNSQTTSHTIEISYTIKNDGNLPVSAASVTMQGYISYDASKPNLMAACGGGFGALASEMINPGATHSGSFRCTLVFEKTWKPVYTLEVDYGNKIKEADEQNNTAQKTILY